MPRRLAADCADLEPDLSRLRTPAAGTRPPPAPDGPCHRSRHSASSVLVQQVTRARAAAAGRSGRRRWPRPARPRRCRPAGRGACPRCWRSTIVSGSAAPTSPTVSWRTSTRTVRRLASSASSSARRQEVGTARPVGHLGPERLLDLERPLLEVHDRLPVHPAQVQPPEPDPLDALLVEPGQPGVVPLGRSRGGRARRRPSATARRTPPGRRPPAARPRRRSRCRPASRRPGPARARRAGAPSWRAPAPSRRGSGASGAPVTTRRTSSSPGSPESR